MRPKKAGNLVVTTPSPLTISVGREFNAPPDVLFDAHTRADLVQRWLLGPGDWSMPECEIDLRVGGEYRYLWRHPTKGDMGLSGKFVEIDPPARLVTTERFDDEWYPGECTNTIKFISDAGRTRMVLTMKYQSEEARNVALNSPMAEGIEAGYERLDELFSHA